MSVDLPAPFSPTMAWMVPGSTRRFTPSLATTPGKRFTMSRSSMAAAPAVTGSVTPVVLAGGRDEGAGYPAPSLVELWAISRRASSGR
jgi:hypothetical protein